MTTALKEIHITNEKKRDANIRFVSLIKEIDPKEALINSYLNRGFEI